MMLACLGRLRAEVWPGAKASVKARTSSADGESAISNFAPDSRRTDISKDLESAGSVLRLFLGPELCIQGLNARHIAIF